MWCEELTHLKTPWCWERLKVGGEGDDRGWDGWMASPTRWTWVGASSGSCWCIGRPGVLPSMGLQRVRCDWATELNWTWLCTCIHLLIILGHVFVDFFLKPVLGESLWLSSALVRVCPGGFRVAPCTVLSESDLLSWHQVALWLLVRLDQWGQENEVRGFLPARRRRAPGLLATALPQEPGDVVF